MMSEPLTTTDDLVAQFLRRGGKITKLARGASAEFPTTLPEGPLRDRAVARVIMRDRNSRLARKSVRAKLHVLLARRAPWLEICTFLLTAQFKFDVYRAIWQMSAFGIEVPAYLRDTVPHDVTGDEFTCPPSSPHRRAAVPDRCVTCNGANGSMEGRRSSRCAYCAGQTNTRAGETRP